MLFGGAQEIIEQSMNTSNSRADDNRLALQDLFYLNTLIGHVGLQNLSSLVELTMVTSATSFGARMAMAEAQVTGPFHPEWKAELVHGNSIELGCLTVDSFLQMIFYMLHYIHIDLYLDSNDNII